MSQAGRVALITGRSQGTGAACPQAPRLTLLDEHAERSHGAAAVCPLIPAAGLTPPKQPANFYLQMLRNLL